MPCAEINAPTDVFLVVWLPDGSRIFYGEPIGVEMIRAGVHKDVKIPLSKDVSAEQTLGVVLHQNTGTQGEFEFELGRDVDIPVMNGRRPVMTVIGTL